MEIEIRNLVIENYKSIIDFYAKYGDRSYDWYNKKFKKDIILGKIIGKICVEKNSNNIVGAYLGRIQPLLRNPSLKAVQSIDTLISPKYRGGKILIRLAREFYDFLKKESFDYVYGLPNLKIKKFRYKFLNWNYSQTTYSYNVIIPIFILRFFFFIINFFIGSKQLFNFTNENIDELKKRLFINNNCLENKDKGAYWISYDSKFFTYIGLCRVGRKLNIFSKLYLLMMMSSKAKTFFLRTYSTANTETASIFNPFSVKIKALDFSGVVLTEQTNLTFKENYFEYIEFDTFGLD
tara:strand:+ start:713 stop:1591 length:879 start_codon:yes stop_codon:yes gene_type:complete